MKNRLAESDIEEFALELLEKRGYRWLYGPDIAPDGAAPARASFGEVILVDRLRAAMARVNPSIPPDAREAALKQLVGLHAPDLVAGNEAFHRLLTESVKVNYRKDGDIRGDYVHAIDFDHPERNEFLAVNQFTVIEGHANKRPDIVLFVNGIPLVVIELKNAADENATVHSAYRQCGTYLREIPSLFTSNGFLVVSDGLDCRAGTISSDFGRFMAWKTSDGATEAPGNAGQLETLVAGMLAPSILLDLVRHFIVFEKDKKEDAKTKQVFIATTKKIAAYHQYHAVNRAVASTLRASGYAARRTSVASGLIVPESPESYGLPGVKAQPAGDRKGGVVWHTQGSGKSLSMVFFSGKIILAMDNPTLVVITDRNDLDDQLFDTFAACRQLLRQEPVQAESREHLKRLLQVVSGGIVFTTMQKFQPEEGNVLQTLSDRDNIIVIADEAHRSQYGFKAKTIDAKDGQGLVAGKKVVYGFAKYLRDALPQATYLGFTGTPIEKADVNTQAVFGNYVDVYDIAQAVEDGATVRMYYESRLAKVALSEKGRKLVENLDDDLEENDLDASQQAKAKWTQLEALIGSRDRIRHIAADIVGHFGLRLSAIDGKGMIVAMSRRIAAELYAEIIALRPEWHDPDLRKGAIKVVMTSASSDGPEISAHYTTKNERRVLSDRMKDPRDSLKLVIVRDMWLTGFDVPCLHTLYIDKPMKGHNLMQAIARVNRVYKDKTGGLIVDYLGLASDLKEALSFYSESGGRGDPAATQEEAVRLMEEKLEVVAAMFHGFPYREYFRAGTGRKLSIILAAEEHILGLSDGKKRFVDEVTALSQAYSIAVPHERAIEANDEIAFFQAVKARLVKFDRSGFGRSDEEIGTAIRQVIDEALVSERVVDIFDAAGIRKPDISILSEDFLMEVRHMKHKNIALEVLRKIMGDEISARMRTNLVQGKSLMEMLEASIRRYHNKIVTAAEVIEEIIGLGKEIRAMDAEGSALGLTTYEYAFYTAVADNESARELMGKEKLRELAVVLYRKIKDNTSIDWTIKENVKAKLKVVIKRTLRQYGYPPDMQKLATETVLRQAEMIAGELAGER